MVIWKKIYLILFTILILFSSVSFAAICPENLKPKINLNDNENLFESVNYYKKINDQSLSYLSYVEINSSFATFNFIKDTQEINFTPSRFDLGKHELLFFAIDNLDCYSAKLVDFYVYDKPRITPLKPDTKYITMDEGQGIMFLIDVEDIDNDTVDYIWKINEKRQIGNFKDRFAFSTSYNSTGNYNLSVTVIDSKNLNDSYQWEIIVREKNREPYLYSEIPDMASPLGKKTGISLNNYFGEPDNDTLHFTITTSDDKGNKIDVETTINNSNQIEMDTKSFTGLLIVDITAKDLFGSSIKSNKFKVYVFSLEDSSQKKNRIIDECGDNICSGNESCNTCNKDCGPCNVGETKCINKWKCGDWSACLPDGYMVKECKDLNACYDQTNKPKQIAKCDMTFSCYDKIRNNGEKNIDCGGPCGPCPTCNDKAQNQGELGIDCGGPCETVCPTCNDRIQNQFESDVDCGGPCEECNDKLKCYSWKDCKSHACKNGLCAVATCIDNVKNQDEKGVDCEGICGGKCPTCTDGLKNQNEENIDCGGVCAPCPTCKDSILNQEEKYIDCGGPCRKCDWSDFEKNNGSRILTLKFIVIIILVPFILLLAYIIGGKLFRKDKIERLILLNHLLWKRKKVFEDKKKIIEEISSNIEKLEKDIIETNRVERREEITNMLSEFLGEIAGIMISNDEETIMESIKSKSVGFPLDRIILFIALETKKISTNKYLSAFEVINKLREINKAISEIKKNT